MKTFLPLAILLAGVPGAQADYRSTVIGDAPAAYWRLDESNITQVCTNYGSAGAALNANYNLGKFGSAAGAIAGDSDRATAFDGVMNRVEVPYTPTLNPAGPFSVEFWALRTIASSANNTYYSPVWSRGNGGVSGVNGFLFYVDPNNKWAFWMGATNANTATNPTWVNAGATAAMVANTWYHVVGTYGPVVSNNVTSWYATLYVNGVQQASKQVDANGFAFQPNCGSASSPSYIAPFRIGSGGYAMTSQCPWPGSVDEVAFYTNALSSLQVSNHWASGTNVTRAVPYSSTILTDAPIGYWRLDETNAPVASNQAGASLGAAANGIYEASPVIPSSVDPTTGILINPLNYPGSLAPLAPGALTGSGDNNPAMNFMPFVAGNSTGAKVEVPYTAGLNTRTFTVECWANLQSLGSFNAPVSSRYNVTGVWSGWDLLVDNTGKLQFWLGTGENSLNKLITANAVFATSTWNHLAAVYDGTYMYLYCNGELVGAMQAPQGFLPNPSAPLRIGAGASEGVQGNFYVNGSVDEVAYYPAPLSSGQIARHYAVGRGAPATPVTAPSFSVQPAAPSTTLETGGWVSLTGIALGSLPMQYQWYKDGALLPNQTNCTLNLSNLTAAASGSYELWATNGVGSAVSSAAYLAVNSASAPQMLADLPATTPFYPGASPHLSVSAGGSLPMTYYWTSNNVAIATTSVPMLSLNNLSAAAAGAHYGLTISNAFGTLPSAGTILQALTPVAGDYVARALALSPLAYWRLGDSASSSLAIDCVGGNHGQYVGVSQHVTPGALGINDDGCAQVNLGGYIQLPSSAPFSSFATTNQFTLMAWIKPDGVTGTQRLFSTRQSSPYNAGFGFGLNGKNLIFSGYGVADTTFTANVVAGQWCHVAAVYSNKTVTCYVNGTVVGTANTVLNALMPSGMPMYLGASPNGTEYFSGLMDEAAVYGSALTASQIITIFGTKPSITLAPVSATALAGSAPRFTILGGGQTPLSYQWRTNGIAVANQTNTLLVFPKVPLALNGLQISCVVTNAMGAITSAPVTLTVVLGTGYVGSVLADQPVAYWRLNESSGPTIYDYVATHDGTAFGSGITYQDVSADTPLAAGGDNDACVAVHGAGAFVVPYYPELNQTNFSVECWAYDVGDGNAYRAPVACRDNPSPSGSGAGYMLFSGSSTYAACGNVWELWTGPGIGNAWDYGCSNNAPVAHYQWTHLVATYDGTQKTLYVNGVPVMTAQLTVIPNSRRVLAIGASGTESYPGSLSSYWQGDLDEVAYYGYALSPYQVMGHCLLATHGDTLAPQITQDLAAQFGYLGQPCSMSAAVAGSVPMTYQWYKGSAPVAGGGGTSLTASNLFALTFPHVQAADAGNYQLWVTNSAGVAGSATAALTVTTLPQLRATSLLSSGGGFQLRFSGPAGQSYRIWTSPDVSRRPIETTWTLLSSGTFSGGPDSFIDPQAQPSTPAQFYVLTIP